MIGAAMSSTSPTKGRWHSVTSLASDRNTTNHSAQRCLSANVSNWPNFCAVLPISKASRPAFIQASAVWAAARKGRVDELRKVSAALSLLLRACSLTSIAAA